MPVKAKADRNKAIYKDRVKKGMTWRSLLVKYGLSLTRLQHIIARERDAR